MKKFVFGVVLFISMFGLTGCGNETLEKQNSNSNVSAGLKEITGKIYQVEIDEDGNIVIDKDKITEEVRWCNNWAFVSKI